MAASHRCIHALAMVLLVDALLFYGHALVEPAVKVVAAGTRGRMWLGWDMLAAIERPYGASGIEVGLWSLNLLFLAAPLLWGLRPKRLLALAPVVVLALGFWIWGAMPASAAEVAGARLVWVLQDGYFWWLGSIVVLAFAITLRWTAFVLAARAWQNRNSAPNARLGVEPASIAHFSSTLRAIIEEAADLRRLLDTSPHDERVHGMVWDWAMRLRRLPEADAAELERLRVPTRSVYVAVEPLWLTEEAVDREVLERVDDALESFLASATTGGHAMAFR